MTVLSCCLLVAAICVAVDISSIDDCFTRVTSAFRLSVIVPIAESRPAGLVVAGSATCGQIAVRDLLAAASVASWMRRVSDE